MKVYKIGTRKTPGIVIFYISKELTDREHNLISRVKEKSDIMFVFSKSSLKTIDPRKMSNLYETVYYGVQKNNNEIYGFWEALDYLESLENYTSLSVIPSKSFYISHDLINNLWSLQISQIETSVFSRRDLNNEEKKKIYVIPKKIIELLFGWRLNIFGRRDNYGMYSRKISYDDVFFLRPKTIKEIRDNITTDILKSFEKSDFGIFISSVVPETSYLNLKINETKI